MEVDNMKRIKILLAALTVLCFGCQTAQINQKPNVILVITDDQGYGDLACHGNEVIKTPHIDAFYNESVRFTNFHVGTTCTPTRGGLMTGRNCNRNGTWHTIGGCSLLHQRETTLADVFSSNGYKTAMYGKWHLGDNYPFRPQDRGFNHTFYHNAGGVGQTPDYWGNDYFDDTYYRNGMPEKTKGYCTDVWFDEAEKFIEQHGEEPFFVYLSLNAPHGPYNVPRKYSDMYDEAPLAQPQKNFYGMITHLDERFGQLRKLIEGKGIADNTLLIFMTDNGTSAGYWYNKKKQTASGFNAGMRGTKGSQYDGGHRVPFFVRWPNGNIDGGTDINTLTAHVDILPTLVDLCHLKSDIKAEMDGVSLQSLLEGKSSAKFEERMLVTDTQRNQWPEKGRNSCVMQGSWRLVNGNELYDVSNDVAQQTNLANQYPDQVKKMEAFYDNWWRSIEKDFDYPVIQLGTQYENPAFLTCHDMHSEQNIPWNQNMIRKGVAFDTGYFLTQITNAGQYKFSISRYPHESDLKMDECVEGLAATKNTAAIFEGKSLVLDKPFININGKEYACKFNADNTAAEVTVSLNDGPAHIYGGFADETGQQVMAYYYKVELLN